MSSIKSSRKSSLSAETYLDTPSITPPALAPYHKQWTAFLSSTSQIRDALLILIGLTYALGYLLWAFNAWYHALGFIPVLEFQYLFSGFIPLVGLIITLSLLMLFVRIQLNQKALSLMLPVQTTRSGLTTSRPVSSGSFWHNVFIIITIILASIWLACFYFYKDMVQEKNSCILILALGKKSIMFSSISYCLFLIGFSTIVAGILNKRVESTHSMIPIIVFYIAFLLCFLTLIS